MLNTRVINKLPAFLPASLARSLPSVPPLGRFLRLCSRSFNTSILDFLMPTANQVACRARIWSAFVTDKPNLCWCVRTPARAKAREKVSVIVAVFCVSVPECVLAVCITRSICVRGMKLKTEHINRQRQYAQTSLVLLHMRFLVAIGRRVREMERGKQGEGTYAKCEQVWGAFWEGRVVCVCWKSNPKTKYALNIWCWNILTLNCLKTIDLA